jgi:hypothetical protein
VCGRAPYADRAWHVVQADIVRHTPDCEVAAERITTEAYRLGSMDNISAVVVRLNCHGPWTTSQRAQTAIKNMSQRGSRRPERLQTAADNPHGVTISVRRDIVEKANGEVGPATASRSSALNGEGSEGNLVGMAGGQLTREGERGAGAGGAGCSSGCKARPSLVLPAAIAP